MPILSRLARPLLSQVAGKPHASSDDHEDGIVVSRENSRPTFMTIAPISPSIHDGKTASREQPKRRRPETIDLTLEDGPVQKKVKVRREAYKSQAEETLPSPDTTDSRTSPPPNEMAAVDAHDADPISSGDEYNEPLKGSGNINVRDLDGFKEIQGIDFGKLPAKKEKEKQKPPFKSTTLQPTKEIMKRKVMNDDELDAVIDSDEERDWGKPSTVRNLHAQKMYGRGRKTKANDNPIFPTLSQPSRNRAAYGRAAAKQQKRTEKIKTLDLAPKPREKVQIKKSFKVAEPIDFGPPGSSQTTAAVHASFTSAGAENEVPDVDDSPLTELSEDELEELGLLEGVPTVRCAYCNEAVKRSLLEDFEVEFLKGHEMTYKWKKRFCTWHQKQEAEAKFIEKGYPNVDWKLLPQRMRAHDSFLRDVINDKVESYYRSELKRKSKKGSKNLQKAITDKERSKGGASMGYYGPRGEKMMCVCPHSISGYKTDVRTEMNTSSVAFLTTFASERQRTNLCRHQVYKVASLASCKSCWRHIWSNYLSRRI